MVLSCLWPHKTKKSLKKHNNIQTPITGLIHRVIQKLNRVRQFMYLLIPLWGFFRNRWWVVSCDRNDEFNGNSLLIHFVTEIEYFIQMINRWNVYWENLYFPWTDIGSESLLRWMNSARKMGHWTHCYIGVNLKCDYLYYGRIIV